MGCRLPPRREPESLGCLGVGGADRRPCPGQLPLLVFVICLSLLGLGRKGRKTGLAFKKKAGVPFASHIVGRAGSLLYLFVYLLYVSLPFSVFLTYLHLYFPLSTLSLLLENLVVPLLCWNYHRVEEH